MWQKQKFRQIADENGWEVKENGDTITATRGDERIVIEWNDGRVTTYPLYVLAGAERKLRNAGEARRYLAATPNYRAVKPRRQAPSPTNAALPFAPDAEDREVLKACYGKTIVWHNSITGEFEDAYIRHKVNFNKNVYYMTVSSSGRRIINFLSATGFRSVGLDRIVQVK